MAVFLGLTEFLLRMLFLKYYFDIQRRKYDVAMVINLKSKVERLMTTQQLNNGL